MSAETLTLNVVEIVTEVQIDAPRETVWKILTDENTAWWHPDYFTDPRGAANGGFHIEARLGGRMYEDWGDGQGLVWGHVVGLDRGSFLQIVGDSSPTWGGPSRNFQTYRLSDAGAGTLLRFENAIYGRVSESTRKSLDQGWQFLFEQALKPYCESGSLPDSGSAPACERG